MDNLVAARLTMAVSLGFHILFAVAGMAMPTLLVIAQVIERRQKSEAARELAHRWAKGTAILFAVGAVSGTVLSFELGLLWPHFMERFGPLIGLPFTLEGFAFFFEGIFLGFLLYGRGKISREKEIMSGVAVAVSGVCGGVLVLAVNGFMNTPTGFDVDGDGHLIHLDPVAAMFNPAFPTEALHMTLAAYAAVSVLVLGIHMALLQRRPASTVHQLAVKISLAVAMVSVPLLLLSGDLAAKHIATHQPVKLAAAEALFTTEKPASLLIGGIPDETTESVAYGIHIPMALSVLAFGDPTAEVRGLDRFPREVRPPVVVTHLAFQTMVGSGMVMLLVVALGAFTWWRRKSPWESAVFRRVAPWSAPVGLIAIEAGWTVTEVGRQPWIVRGHMRVVDALTPVDGLALHFLLFTSLYVALGVVVVVLLRRHLSSSVEGE